MDQQSVEAKLIQVLERIQAASKKPSPKITAETRPLDDLPGFDSKLWPAAVSMLAAELGITIPVEENIFLSPDGKRRLTIRESAARVISLAKGRPAPTRVPTSDA